MRRRLRVMFGVLTVAAGVPASANAQAPVGDSVVGSLISVSSLNIGFEVAAYSGPSGETPAGTISWDSRAGGGQTSRATVSCLSVTRNTAVIGFTGEARESRFGLRWAIAGFARVVDAGGPTEDTVAAAYTFVGDAFGPFVPVPGPSDCSSFPSNAPGDTYEEGDLVVTDAQPFPTTKTQCKNGGWRNYGATFKNQGQCAAFVQRGPKH